MTDIRDSQDRSQGGSVPVPSPPRGRSGSRLGLVYGLSAYVIWGFIPLYFRAVASVRPLVILCHRVIWSALFIALIVSLRGEWSAIVAILRHRRSLQLLSAGSILMALNWLIFIYSVASHQLLQASLGYFINPLLSIALGMIFLRERLRPGQWFAVVIALVAVGNMSLRATGFPWIAVSLAGSFGFYGLIRKKVDINSLHGLLVESGILLLPAALGLGMLTSAPQSSATLGMLSLSGVITAVPLLFFGAALRRLKLSTMGFLQYVGPTLQFLVATCFFHEPLDRVKLTSFGLCWLGIALYSADSIRHHASQAVADEPD